MPTLRAFLYPNVSRCSTSILIAFANASNVATFGPLLVVIAALGLLAFSAESAELRVPSDYPTIPQALSAAHSGDVVLVAPGTYSDTEVGIVAYTEVSYCGKIPLGVTLQSEAGSANTRIRVPGSNPPDFLPTYSFVSSGGSYGYQSPNRGTSTTRIQGFSISADSGTSGGCAFLENHVEISDCIFDGLSTTPPFPWNERGTAISSFNAEVIVRNSIFQECGSEDLGAIASAQYGRSIYSWFEDCEFTRCPNVVIVGWSGGVGSHGIDFNRCSFVDNAEGVARIFGGGSAFRGCRFEGNRGNPVIDFGNARGAWIEDCQFLRNTSSASAIVKVTGEWQNTEDESKSIQSSIFRGNTASTGCIEWNSVGGSIRQNCFLENSGTTASVASIVPFRLITMSQNLFCKNGPQQVLSVSNPIKVTSQCNMTWDNAGAAPSGAGFFEEDPQLCDPLPEIPTVSASSPCLESNRLGICGGVGHLLPGCDDRGTTTISIESEPSPLEVTIEGELRWTPTFLTKPTTSEATVGCSSIQPGGAGERFVWNSWSDGGALEHEVVFEQEPRLVTASFAREFLLQTQTFSGGHTIPEQSWLPEGSVAMITAIPNVHRAFVRWAGVGNGAYSGTSNPATVTMHGPIAEEATFEVVSYPITFVGNGGGTTNPASGMYLAETTLEIRATPDPIHDFVSWIGTGPGSYTGADPVATISVVGTITQQAVFMPTRAGFEFTISASGEDPFLTHSPATGTWRALHLWATCLDRGISAFEGEVSTTLPISSFQPVGGVLNAGSGDHLLLAIPGCPTGSQTNLRLGYWYSEDTGGTVCINPASNSGVLGVVDCMVSGPFLWQSPSVVGFSSNSSPECVSGNLTCTNTTPDPETQSPPAGDGTGAIGTVVPLANSLNVQPNPFLDLATLRFGLAKASQVSISILDVRGRVVKRWADRQFEAGEHVLSWDGRDASGKQTSSAVYFARISAEEYSEVRRFVRLKR